MSARVSVRADETDAHGVMTALSSAHLVARLKMATVVSKGVATLLHVVSATDQRVIVRLAGHARC